MSQFGQLSYGQRQKQFIGQPVEDIANVNASLIDRYHSNRQHIDELRIMEKNIDLIDHPNDKAILRSQIDNTDKILKNVHETGAYEHAFDAVREAGTEFATNKGLQTAIQERQQQKQVFENIDSMEGLSTKYKGIAKKMSMDSYQGTRQDENGEWIGGFNGYVPPKPVDGTEIADEILKGINSNRISESGWDLASAEANAAAQVYMQNTGISIEEITPERVGEIVKTYLSTNAEASAWAEAKAEMDTYAEYGNDGIPTIEAASSRLYSRTELKQRANREEKKKGETDEEFFTRIDNEYKDEIEQYVSDTVSNLQSKYKEEGIDYDMKDLMRNVYQNALVTEHTQASMDILANKYGFRKHDIKRDIKLNEFNKRLHDQQSKYHAQILGGPDIALRASTVREDRKEVQNRITSMNKQLDSLKYNRSVSTDPDDIENYDIQIREVENQLSNLRIRKDDFDRRYNSILGDTDTNDIISDSLANTLKKQHDRGIIGDDDIRFIRDAIKDGMSADEVIEELGEKVEWGKKGLGWKGIFLNSDMSLKDMDDYVRNLGDLTLFAEQGLFRLLGLYGEERSEEVLSEINTLLFKNLYESSSKSFDKKIDEMEPAKHRGTFSIFTDGHEGLKAQETFLIKGIKDGNINLRDLNTGTTFQLKETKEIIDNADEISIAFGGVVDSDNDYPVFHVTARYKDDDNKHFITSIDDLDQNLLRSYMEGLSDIKNATQSDVTKRTLHNYLGMMEGHMVPTANYGNIGKAVEQKNLHNLKPGESNTIGLNELGDMSVKRHSDGTYTIKLNRNGESVNLAGEGNYFRNIEDMYAPFGKLYNDILNRTRQ